MKFKLLFLILFISVLAWGEVSFLKVTNEKNYDSVKDFTNTYELNLNKHKSSDILKCQAVRLAKNWFITAAHCVKDTCDDNNCSFQARLMVGPDYEVDFTTSSGQKLSKKIFTFSKTKINKNDLLYDIALIYFNPKDTNTVFKDPIKKRFISEAEFLRRIPNKAAYLRALNGTNLPTILVMDKNKPVVINRNLSIISIWSGKKSLLKNTKAPIFYLPKLSHIVTRNFGVIKGISGSGVMTNTGELLGIVSAKADLKSSDSDLTIPLVYITPFDKENIAFIKKHIPGISYILADENYYRKPTKKESKELKVIENLKFNLR